MPLNYMALESSRSVKERPFYRKKLQVPQPSKLALSSRTLQLFCSVGVLCLPGLEINVSYEASWLRGPTQPQVLCHLLGAQLELNLCNPMSL